MSVWRVGWCELVLLAGLACMATACAPSLSGESLLDKRLDAPALTTSASQKQARLDKFLQSQSANTGKVPFEGFTQQGTDGLT